MYSIFKANLKTIFKKFERLNPEVEGTAIGLYLVYNIITSSGGSISLNSEVGSGSHFVITIIDALKASDQKSK
ncbi:ATP-binding protein [Pedobacter lithocola]|uniref:histidine kinase n=1 Tax=Pedobacter lithocola TaxID=1908239 RepID=A0ABV8PG34_9SPHI